MLCLLYTHRSLFSLSFSLIHRVYQVGERAFSDGGRGFRTRNPLTSKQSTGMSYADFVYFMMSDIDKTTTVSLKYWFRCFDVDGDGKVSIGILQRMYKNQFERLQCAHRDTKGRVDLYSFDGMLLYLFDRLHIQLQSDTNTKTTTTTTTSNSIVSTGVCIDEDTDAEVNMVKQRFDRLDVRDVPLVTRNTVSNTKNLNNREDKFLTIENFIHSPIPVTITGSTALVKDEMISPLISPVNSVDCSDDYIDCCYDNICTSETTNPLIRRKREIDREHRLESGHFFNAFCNLGQYLLHEDRSIEEMKLRKGRADYFHQFFASQLTVTTTTIETKSKEIEVVTNVNGNNTKVKVQDDSNVSIKIQLTKGSHNSIELRKQGIDDEKNEALSLRLLESPNPTKNILETMNHHHHLKSGSIVVNGAGVVRLVTMNDWDRYVETTYKKKEWRNKENSTVTVSIAAASTSK